MQLAKILKLPEAGTSPLPDYKCSKCKDTGWIIGEEEAMECQCSIDRRNALLLKQSGLDKVIDTYTFERYIAKEPWQKQVLEKAKDYVADYNNKWFFIGGQVGCGKTHICTAIVKELLQQNIPAKYMLWRDEIVPLKACVTDDEMYQNKIYRLKTITCLYIDDFFKTEKGKYPTTADVNIAFEVVNHRYNNKLSTIISSEKTIDELLDIDEAVGSRIYQMTKESYVEIGNDRSKNMRLR